MSGGKPKNSRLYIGNLNYDTSLRQIREAFSKYGHISSIHKKNGYAFVVPTHNFRRSKIPRRRAEPGKKCTCSTSTAG